MFTYLGEKDLERFLDGVFKNSRKITVSADEAEQRSFLAFMKEYKKCLEVERHAAEILLRS